MHKQYSHHSLIFISGIAPLPAGLNSTSTESRKNTGMAPLLVSLVSTPAELLASPSSTECMSCTFTHLCSVVTCKLRVCPSSSLYLSCLLVFVTTMFSNRAFTNMGQPMRRLLHWKYHFMWDGPCTISLEVGVMFAFELFACMHICFFLCVFVCLLVCFITPFSFAFVYVSCFCFWLIFLLLSVG